MKLYGISGLGADKRVFKKLNIKCELISIDWIEVREKESRFRIPKTIVGFSNAPQ